MPAEENAAEVAALTASLQQVQTDADNMWLLIAAMMVFFMQAGFSLVEAGSVRMANVQNILMKNLLDVCMGCIAFWIVGYAFAYGSSTPESCLNMGEPSFDKGACVGKQNGNVFIGDTNFALWDIREQWALWFFQFAFAATAATIVSGSMAERTDFRAYLAYTILITGFVYPVVVHWCWSASGFLSAFRQEWSLVNTTLANGTVTGEKVAPTTKPVLGQVGLIDFAGSGVVHMVGGLAGLIGTMTLGPRRGRFDAKTGAVLVLRSHNLVISSLGVWILWFGWYGFNPGSTLGISGISTIAAKAAVTTTISAAFAGLSSMILAKLVFDVFDLQISLNGVLGGLVSITAGCATVDPWGAAIIGALGGAVYFGASQLLLKHQIDDPCDAAPVHLFCGMWGVVAAGLFSTKGGVEKVYGIKDATDYGLFLGGNVQQLGIQTLAIGVILAWTGLLMSLLFAGLKFFRMLRVDQKTEHDGLDMTHHGGRYAYDFNVGGFSDSESDVELEGKPGMTSTSSRDQESSTPSTESSIEEPKRRKKHQRK